MVLFPVVRDPGSIELLLKHIRSSVVPPVADGSYLRDQGFRREGDDNLMDLLLFLGFIDDRSRPTDLWVEYRETGPIGARLLAAAVRSGYAPLLEICPGATDQGVAEVVPHFRKLTSSPDTELTLMYYTFRVLCDLAGPAVKEDLPSLASLTGKPAVRTQASSPPPAPAAHPAQPPQVPPRVQIPVQPVVPQPASAVPSPQAPSTGTGSAGPGAGPATGLASAPRVTVEPSGRGGFRITMVLEIDPASDPALADLAGQLALRVLRDEVQRGTSS